MSATAIATVSFEVSDVTGQKVLSVSNVPDDVTVSDLIGGLVERMRLPANDASGRPLSYHARLDREGRHLQGHERVATSVRPGDRVVLQPNVDAGGIADAGDITRRVGC
jgi:hypothetical protein